jgi:hypothetical protein
MREFQTVAGRTFAALWVATLGFLVLAQPAHAFLGTGAIALVAQVVGAALLAVLFALRGEILRQGARLVAFLERSRGLRAIVRSVAAEALTLPGPTSRDASETTGPETDGTAATSEGPSPSQWTTRAPASSAGAGGTSLRTAASAPRRPTPPFPPTTA